MLRTELEALIERAPGLIADRWENCDSVTAEWIEAAAKALPALLIRIEGLEKALASIVDATKEAACDLAVVTLTIRFDEVHELARQALAQSQESNNG